MDVVLALADDAALDGVYEWAAPGSAWAARDSIARQAMSLFAITLVGGATLYFVFAGLSFVLLFDKDTLKDKRALQNQVAKEIWCAVTSMPGMTALTVPIFIAEVRGYGKLHVEANPLDLALSAVGFVLFTDCCIYWIHRALHSNLLYGPLHKVSRLCA